MSRARDWWTSCLRNSVKNKCNRGNDKSIPVAAEHVLKRLQKVTLWLNMAVAFAMMAVVVYGVITRYVFRAPVSWVAEISEFMMVAFAFLALAYIQHQRQHVRVSFFLIRQGEKTQRMLGVVISLCALAMFALITWAGWEFALKALRAGFKTDAASFPLFPARLLVPIGSLLICLQLVAELGRGISLLLGHAAGGRLDTLQKTEHRHGNGGN